MTRLAWDQTGEKIYETGVDRCVLYPVGPTGLYDTGYAWNGLTALTESPSGAEPTKLYADNGVYVTMTSAEEYACTIEAYTYPTAFEECDGSASLGTGITIGQQTRKSFGLSYRTLIGNDLVGTEYGYKIHLVYGGIAAPSERANATVNDSPEAMTNSWEVSTTPVPTGGNNKPTATLTIDSTKVNAARLASFEDIIYGTAGTNARLPLPAEVAAHFAGSDTEVEPTQPTFVAATGVITIPTVAGVDYLIGGTVRTGTYTIATAGASVIVTARAKPGYKFPPNTDEDWQFTRSP